MVSSVVDRKQKGPLCDRKGERANVAPYTQEAPRMRLSVTSLRRMVKRPLQVEFGPQQFTQATLGPLVQLNHDLVIDAVRRLALPRLTIDIDGTVVRTGATVGWAFRGFNPHHRKDPSYYPLLAHVAQTGHILRVKNRPGNV